MASTTIQLLTYSIVGIIAIMTVISLLTSNLRLINNAPSMLTSLGIFGTFLGITVGLSSFDPDAVRASIPLLFRGIQLAFWTSVAGILGGILVKARMLLWPIQEAGPGARETFTDMVGALRGVESSLTDADGSPLLSALEKLMAETREQATVTHKALNTLLSAPGVSGASDQALMEKLTAVSDSSARGLKDLQGQSDAAVKALSEESSKRFEKLTQQLGATQEEILNRIEAAMLDELRGLHTDSNVRLEQLHEAMDKVYNALPGSEYSSGLLSRMDALRENSQQLGERMSEALAQAFEANRETLGAQMTRVAGELRDALAGSKDAATEIGQNLQKGQADLAKAVTQATTDVKKTVSADMGELARLLAAGSEQAAAQAHQLNETVAALHGGMSKDTTALIDRLEKSQAELSADLGKTLDQAAGGMQKAVGTDLATLHKQLSASSEQAARQTKDLTQALATLRSGLGDDSTAVLERLDSLRENSAALGEGIREAARASTDALREGLEASRDAMAAQITQAVTEMRDSLVGPEGAASHLAARLDEMQHTLAEAFAGSSEALRTAAAADTVSLVDRLNAVSDGIQNMTDTLAGSFGEVAGGLSGDVSTLASNLTDAMDDLRLALAGPDGAVAALGETLGESQSALAAAMDKASTELRETVGSDAAALKDMLGADAAALRKALAKVLQDSTTELRAAVGADTASLKEIIGADGAALRKTLAAALEDSSARLQQVVSQDTAALKDAITADAAALRENLGADTAALQQAMSRDAVELQKAIAKNTTDLQQLMGTDLAAVQKALAKDTATLQKAMGKDAVAAGKQMAALEKSVTGLNKSLEAVVGKSKGGIADDIQAVGKQVLGGLDNLTKAITGPKGATAGLAEEIRKSQKATSGELASIRNALEENTKRQIDYSPKKLLEVLEEMIKQFNTQFAGQFWDKLGGFGDAVAELIEWMETYRKQIDDMLHQQTRSAKNMDTAARRFDDIASKSEIFIDVSKNIAVLLGGLDSQRVQLEGHLKRFAHIVDETSANLENIEDKIVAGNVEMNGHIEEISKRIEDQIIRVDRGMEEELTKALTTFGQQLAALSEKFVDDYTPLTERLREVVSIARGV